MIRRFGARGVFGALLAGALIASVFGSTGLAEWADSHADRPGGQALAAALHGWDDLVGAAGAPRAWLRDRARRLVDGRF